MFFLSLSPGNDFIMTNKISITTIKHALRFIFNDRPSTKKTTQLMKLYMKRYKNEKFDEYHGTTL